MNTQKMKAGERLSNGALLLHWKEEQDSVVVLALINNEYATWLLDAHGSPYSGHYHPDIFSAIDEFKKRS